MVTAPMPQRARRRAGQSLAALVALAIADLAIADLALAVQADAILPRLAARHFNTVLVPVA
jgi:hypothetical protein